MYFLLTLFLCVHAINAQQKDNDTALDIHIEATENEKLPLLICVVGDAVQLKEVVPVLRDDLMFSGQFDVHVASCAAIAAPSDIARYAQQGYPLVLFLHVGDDAHAIEWRMYDTDSVQMVSGKKYHKRGTHAREWAHHLADSVWPVLTCQDGFFSTKLAYCKQVCTKKGHRCTHVYVAEFDGKNPRPLVTTQTVNIAPCWNRNSNNPLLFYSENTNKNIRLMTCTMHGKARIAASSDGITMLPTFSRDEAHVAYCASHGKGACQIYMYEKGAIKQITDGIGNALNPSLSDDGTIMYYCCDKTGSSQVYRADLGTGNHEQITHDGTHYSPSYSSKRNAVIYTKMIKGVGQLFVYDEVSKEHTQLTFDGGHKGECSWSACGNYVVFGLDEGNSERIALLNLMTNERRILTSAHDRCSYPALSGLY